MKGKAVKLIKDIAKKYIHEIRAELQECFFKQEDNLLSDSESEDSSPFPRSTASEGSDDSDSKTLVTAPEPESDLLLRDLELEDDFKDILLQIETATAFKAKKIADSTSSGSEYVSKREPFKRPTQQRNKEKSRLRHPVQRATTSNSELSNDNEPTKTRRRQSRNELVTPQIKLVPISQKQRSHQRSSTYSGARERSLQSSGTTEQSHQRSSSYSGATEQSFGATEQPHQRSSSYSGATEQSFQSPSATVRSFQSPGATVRSWCHRAILSKS